MTTSKSVSLGPAADRSDDQTSTRPPRALVVAGVILVLAVLAIVYFDLSTTVAMNDEYAYFFSVRNLGG
ncbi:MAG TPA: hypothetical protein VFR33_02220, partial [Candidatus Dormibacteraeota bacterium]|nr:hypothetical protein [Candidatus Dormibacteraeota bacterium]